MTKVKFKEEKFLIRQRLCSEHEDFLKVSGLHSLNQLPKTFKKF